MFILGFMDREIGKISDPSLVIENASFERNGGKSAFMVMEEYFRSMATEMNCEATAIRNREDNGSKDKWTGTLTFGRAVSRAK